MTGATYAPRFAYSAEIEAGMELLDSYHLSAAHPNPFNPQTSFTLVVAARQQVTVEVYDVLGRRVAVLHQGVLEAGEAHRFTFDASGLPGGVYLHQVTGEAFRAVQKTVLAK